ncbi:hypothetical protein [Saccharopolyspora hattusasensis]|uniref:hypothetical protein n=1 Tax=Saccharopolyspora hattusasensis TaxID=1128679 RepID=UPI003D99DF1C
MFQDFCELSALAIRNAGDHDGSDAREARYLAIAATYTPEEMRRFAEALAQIVLTLNGRRSDALGHLYMSLGLGNERLGQFFTPYEISLLAAKITVNDVTNHREDMSSSPSTSPPADPAERASPPRRPSARPVSTTRRLCTSPRKISTSQPCT